MADNSSNALYKNQMKNSVYLDYNATAPLRPEAIDAMTRALAEPHNASSVHSYGREGRKIIEDARQTIAALINAPVNQIIFNSGATEGNNTVLKFFANERILASSIEHPSVLDAAPNAERIPVAKDGVADLNALEKLLKNDRAALVSVMMVNNETGAVQPIKEIAAIAHSHGALFHCDATQAIGRMPIDMTGIDFMTFSAHKLGGPQGIGALVLGLCGVTPTLLDGGGQEKKARAGTENVAAIAGFGAACAVANAQEFQKLSAMRDHLETELKKISNEIVIYATNAPRVANTSMFSMPGASSETLLMAFDLEGIALSNGSACASGTVRASHVLKAMQVNDALAASALRVSLGWNSKKDDVEKLLAAAQKIVQRLKK